MWNVLFDEGSLHPEFFDLSSGFAGDMMQKLVNYGIRAGIFVHDMAMYSDAFRDFARALREHQDAVLGPARTASRAPLLVAALGLPLGAVSGSVLSTAGWFSAAPLSSLVAGFAFLSSAALIVLQSKRPSLRSFIAHNTALWGGVVAGSLAAIAVLGMGTPSEVPWLVMIVSGVRNWITSTVLGSAAVIAMRRANIRKRDNPEVREATFEPSASERSQSFLNRMLGWLNVTRRTGQYRRLLTVYEFIRS